MADAGADSTSRPVSMVEAVVQQSRELSMLGRFDDAIQLLDTWEQKLQHDLSELIQVYRAAARVFVTRGYPRVAQTMIQKALDTAGEEGEDDTMLQLKVHAAFISKVACGESLLEDDPCLEEARETLTTFESYEQFPEGTIEMQSFVDRITLFRQVVCQRAKAEVKPAISSRLNHLLLEAQKQHRYHDVWLLSLPYCTAAERSGVIAWRKAILADDNLPDPFYASVSIELAKELAVMSQLADCEVWLSKADEAFKRCNHAFGRTEVRRVRLYYGFVNSPNTLKDLVDILGYYLQANYPLGMLGAALSPLTLAFNNGRYAVYVNLQEVFHNVCVAAGIRLERILLEVQLLAALNASTGHYGKVVELGRLLYRECSSSGFFTIQYMVGRVLCLADHQLENTREAEEKAEEIYELCEREDLKAKSEAAYNLAVMRNRRETRSDKERLDLCLEIIQLLLDTVDRDIAVGEGKMACEKLHFVAGLQFEIARKTPGSYAQLKAAATESIERARTLAKGMQSMERIAVIAAGDELAANQLLYEGSMKTTHENEFRCVKIFEDLAEVYQAHGMKFLSAMKYQFKGLCYIQIYQKNKNAPERLEHLVAAEQSYQTALKGLEAMNAVQQLVVCRHALARIYVIAWELNATTTEVVEKSLLQLETATDAMRRELATLGSLTALIQKQRFAAGVQVQDLYTWATAVNLITQKDDRVWLWSQKRKARSLSDMLGLGVVVPESVKRAITADPKAKELFERMNVLQGALTTAPENEKGYVRVRLDEVNAEMRHHMGFKDFMTLRDGAVDDIAQIKALQNASQNGNQPLHIIFAEYITYRDNLYLLTADAATPRSSCKKFTLSLSASCVRTWTRQHFATDEERKSCLKQDNLKDATKPMRSLDPLVAPLLDASQAGDLLVLSPTAILSFIPLHALKVVDEEGHDVPLIERNPVVYIPSFPVAQVCLSRGLQLDCAGSSIFFGIFDNEEEGKQIYAQMAKIATTMGGRSFCGDQASKTAFQTVVGDAALLHFHGHCKFNADNVLQQSLVLYDPHKGEKPMELNAEHFPPSSHQSSSEEKATADKCAIAGAVGAVSLEDHGLKEMQPDITTSAKASRHQLQLLADDESASLLLQLSDADATSQITVEEIFKVVLRSTLVVLIACESAAQTISAGDEPLGMISGLLCAGAASVIGASWPIPSGVGRAFSEAFYKELGNSHDDLIDLAAAVQEAVLTVRDNPRTSSTYYWGGFCLHGSWLLRNMSNRSQRKADSTASGEPSSG